MSKIIIPKSRYERKKLAIQAIGNLNRKLWIITFAFLVAVALNNYWVYFLFTLFMGNEFTTFGKVFDRLLADLYKEVQEYEINSREHERNINVKV